MPGGLSGAVGRNARPQKVRVLSFARGNRVRPAEDLRIAPEVQEWPRAFGLVRVYGALVPDFKLLPYRHARRNIWPLA